MSAWCQSSIDWAYPPDPSPWSDEEREALRRRARAALAALREELGEGRQVRDESLL
ncbi:hypothetical protein [Streptomyces sp. NPDC048282]|uniref:hypothetical protein n=1 Tax=Streptomyces sp. NPDC048282 TaxID=3365528 RepID=UPI003711DBC1